MPQILSVQLNAAKFLVGPKLELLEGAAEDYFSISAASDVGSIIGGLGGDVALVNRINNAYTASISLMQASRGVGTLLQFLGTYFPVKVSYDEFEFVGVAVIMNQGELVASVSNQTRTITLGMAYQAGNILVGSGKLIT